MKALKKERLHNKRIHRAELKGYACPIGGTFFDELSFLVIGFDRGQPPTEKQVS